jgi:hypothetical protein
MLDDFRDLISYTEGRIILLTTFLAIAMIALGVVGALEEEKQWKQFAADHDCVKVGEMKGTVSTGIGYGMTTNGQMGTVVTTIAESDKIGWRCNDGVTYWR